MGRAHAFYVGSSLLLCIFIILRSLEAAVGDRNIFRCDFESRNDCGFRQDMSDDMDWDLFHRNRLKLSRNSRAIRQETPVGSNVGRGHHARVRAASVGDTGRASITSPQFNLTDGLAEVSFLYHMWNSNSPHIDTFHGALNLYACRKQLVWTKSKNLGDVWYQTTIRFHCNGTFQLTFEGVIGSPNPDIAIDDVFVTDCFNDTYTSTPSSFTTTTATTTHSKFPYHKGKTTELITSDPKTETFEIINTTRSSISSSERLSTGISLISNSSSFLTDSPTMEAEAEVISSEVAVSLIVVAVILFATTCLLLILTIVLHCTNCCCRLSADNYPAHIIYHAPAFYNHDAEIGREEYMRLNFGRRARSSISTASGTDFVSSSNKEKRYTDSGRLKHRASFSGFCGPTGGTTRVIGRRITQTFPVVREIKNFLHDMHIRRLRTFSSQLTAAELELIRQRLNTPPKQRERTMSTILIERSTSSTIRPISEISEHFYYSLFPDANRDLVLETESARSSIVDPRMEVPARIGTIELLSSPGRPRRLNTGTSYHISFSTASTSADVTPKSDRSVNIQRRQVQSAPNISESTEMVDNEVYETYSDDEVKC